MSEIRCEVCIDSVEGARAAEAGGAHRVELCAALVEGGITPSTGMIQEVRRVTELELMVMIRPRGGDFLYSAAELEVMKADIDGARDGGAAGVVLGALQPDGSIDVAVTGELVEYARPLAVTFHRAFDLIRNGAEGLEQLVDLGVDRVLTSGLAADVVAGQAVIGDLVAQAGERITVVAGGGVREGNIAGLIAATGVSEVHFSARRRRTSAMGHRREILLGATQVPGEYERAVTDPDLVRAFVRAASSE